MHSIKGSPSEVTDVGIFSDNANKTMYKFLEAFELGYIDWRNNRQCASKLTTHLSDDLKDKLLTHFNSYELMREWLINNYGGALRIVNDTIMALARRRKPAANDRSQRHSHLSVIIAALQR